MRKFVVCSGFFIVAAVLGAAAQAGNKVTICHYPSGDPENPQTITVSENAVKAHLAHGDTIGECSATGCQLDPTLCDDGNLCTFDECLDNGECDNSAIDCDDTNPCTLDLCDAGTGCLNPPNDGVSCDDGNACTENDNCADSVCAGQDIPECCLADLDCDDGDLCTVDHCTDYRCANLPPDCTITGDQCVVGFCDPGTGDCASAPVSCDDGNVCTDDYCDTIAGCYSIPTVEPPQDPETSCDDGADNDCDGFIDCDDDDCPFAVETACDDGADNDCDGLIDLDDDDCTHCPCWTDAEIAVPFAAVDTGCGSAPPPMTTHIYSDPVGGPWQFAQVEGSVASGQWRCVLLDEAPEPQVSVLLVITPFEYSVCAQSILDECATRSLFP